MVPLVFATRSGGAPTRPVLPPPRPACATFEGVLLVMVADGGEWSAEGVALTRSMYSAAFPDIEFVATTAHSVLGAGTNGTSLAVLGCADPAVAGAGACSPATGLGESERRAALSYECLSTAARRRPGKTGYLLVHQSTVLNFWNLRRLPLDRPWLPSDFVGHTRDVTAVGAPDADVVGTDDIAMWEDPVYGRRAARKALTSLPPQRTCQCSESLCIRCPATGRFTAA